MISLNEIEKRLSEIDLPKSISIQPAQTIEDVGHMISTHIILLRANPGNRLFLPYYYRLRRLLKVLSS